MFEALSMLTAAKEGYMPDKEDAVEEFGERSKRILREIGMKEDEINSEYPDQALNEGLFLLCNNPTAFAHQALASAAWLIRKN